MAELNLLKHGTLTRRPNKTCEDYINLLSFVPCACLFFGIDWLSPIVGEFGHSHHTSGRSSLADPSSSHADAIRYPDTNIHMWYCGWFYNIS